MTGKRRDLRPIVGAAAAPSGQSSAVPGAIEVAVESDKRTLDGHRDSGVEFGDPDQPAAEQPGQLSRRLLVVALRRGPVLARVSIALLPGDATEEQAEVVQQPDRPLDIVGS